MHVKARTGSRNIEQIDSFCDTIDFIDRLNSFTASDREAKPSRRGGAPSDPQPRPRPGAVARPNVPAPMHSARQSIASSHSSKRRWALVQLFSSLRELAAALG